MKEILVTLGILVLVWLVVMLSGCTQTYYKTIPIRDNSRSANCIRNNSDGTQSLAICPKKLLDKNGDEVFI